jgi:site-specific DNA recombinase
MKVDGYIRVSRVNGRSGEGFISPRLQREKIQAFAKLHGHKVARWHEDLDQPGSKNDRPGFQAAIERVEAGKTNGIAVAKLDRFARSVADAASAIRRIRDAGGELISVEDNFDSSTPMGKFAMHMLLALGELELDRIRESWSNAQRYAVERGVHVASRTPTGYQRKRDGRLERDEKAAPVVAEVFAQRAAGASFAQLARLLEAHGIRGPYRNRHWTVAAVSKLLRNPVYLGEARSGRYRNEDAHEPIVPRETWEAVQGGKAQAWPRTGEGALLAGLLRCAGCRYLMKPDTMKGHNGEKLRIYRCRGDHAAGRCLAPASVLGRVIEPYVQDEFLAALGPGGVLAHVEPTGSNRAEAQERLQVAEQELEAFIEMTPASIDRDAYQKGVEKRQHAVDEARVALAESGEPSELDGLLGDVSLGENWPQLPLSRRRELLGLGIDAIMLRRGRDLVNRTHCLWRGDPEALELPRRGRRLPLASFPWPDERDDEPRVKVAKDREEALLDRPPRRRGHRAVATA